MIDYEVIRQLGEGGMGCVYEAIHHPTGSVVAARGTYMEIPDNPNWRQVVEFLKAHVRPTERILATDHFLNEFAQVYPPQSRRDWQVDRSRGPALSAWVKRSKAVN